MEELQKLIDDITSFSNKTFGERQGNPAMLYHLKEEVDEAIKVITDKQCFSFYEIEDEYADMLILLLDSARMQGMDAEELLHIANRKLAINKKRKWGKPDKNGVIKHIK